MRIAKLSAKVLLFVMTIFVIPAFFAATLSAKEPQSRDEAIRSHVAAIEASAGMDTDEALSVLESSHLFEDYLSATTQGQRRELVADIQSAMRAARNIAVFLDNGGVIVRASGDVVINVAFALEEDAPWRIVSLSLEAEDQAAALDMSPDGIADTFDRLAAESDFSGVVYFRQDGEVILRQAYGMADPAAGRAMTTETIFDIGSRPIDFTIAAILLLDQQGKLALNDPVTKYFDDVPADKQSMTLLHLLNGMSGLQDFHGLPSDEDQDLSWIDRAEAERRILAQELLFTPGEGQRHSHSAFGLLASVVERASGQDYMTFLREHFFEPAGMNHTGEYGEWNGHEAEDFAVGGGPSVVGELNIPLYWGRTSWLVKGSGGMYSTLDDLIAFYEYLGSGAVLEERYLPTFMTAGVNLDGTDRGFELFSAYDEGRADQVFLFVNRRGDPAMFETITSSLEAAVMND